MGRNKYIPDELKAAPSADNVEARKEYAAIFAKALAQQTIHDPAGNTSKRTSRTFATYTQSQIEEWLRNPTANEKNLRNASVHLYQTNSRYRGLLHYYANVPTWTYVITPLGFNKTKVKSEAFLKQYHKVCDILESMGIVKTMREASLVALREGVFYGVVWGGDGKSFILQKLNPDNCQIVSITDGGVFQFAYDMSKVKEEDLDTYYPPQFKQMYEAYNASGNQYQIVPLEISFCVKGDPSIAEYSLPPFAGVLPGLYTLKNVEATTEVNSELSNYKLLTAKVPVDEQGTPTIDYPTVMQYYSHIANNVGERVGVAVSPFELKSHDFEQSGTAAQVDTVARANENFFAAAGTSALLHGTSNSTSGVTKLAVNVDEAFSFSIMYQCGAIINRFLKTLPGTVKFKMNFLPVSIFNRKEMIDMYRNSMNYGIGKLQYAACIGVPQHDLQGQTYLENEILDFNNMFAPMKTASTQSSGESEENSGGRPVQDDISDAGEATRDNDANSNR